MKIVMAVAEFPKLSETFIASKFEGLRARGHQVELVCTSGKRGPGVRVRWPLRPRWLAAVLAPAAALRCLLQAPGATLRYLGRGWRRFGWDVWRRLYLDAEFLLARPEVLHFEFGPLAVGRMYLRELLGCRIVVSFRGYDLNYVALEDGKYYSEVWENVDGVHVLGRELWEKARQRGCPPDLPHAVISPAIDVNYFTGAPRERGELGTAGRPLRLLSVARLKWTKGYEFALEAVARLRDQGIYVEYHIIGTGEHLPAVAFCRRQLSLEDQVSLLGGQPREKVLEQMRWADLFLHAAVSEGFSNAVIEAQATGLPVVTSDATGLSENVQHGVTGFVVPRRNPAALAEKILLLARDPILRLRMGAAGRERARQHFTLPDQLSAFEEFYRRVGAPPAASPGRTETANERADRPYLLRRA